MSEKGRVGVVGISSRAAWNVISLAYSMRLKVLLVANRIVPESVGLSGFKTLDTLAKDDMNVPFLTGVVRPKSKRLVVSEAESYGLRFPEALVSSGANLAYGVDLGAGTIVHEMTGIGPFSVIEDHATVRAGVVIGHHSKIGAFSHLSGGVTLAGGVSLGPSVFVGVGACIRDGVVVGAGATIGMGAVVVKDVEPGDTVVGNPARVMK